jgi:ketosteroid isomerase-like protein
MTTQHNPPASPRSTGEPVRDPAAMHRYFAEACNAGDLDRLLAFYEPGAVVAERTGELTIGTDAIRAHLETLLSMRPTMHILSSKTVENGDLAQLSSRWECDATAPDGSAVHLESRGSELARRQPDATWRLVIDNPWGAG